MEVDEQKIKSKNGKDDEAMKNNNNNQPAD